MRTALQQQISALLRDPAGAVHDYLRLLRESERLGCEQSRDFLLRLIQTDFPRSLDLAAPKRAVTAFDAIDSIIRSVRLRFSISGNTLPNRAVACIGMTNLVASNRSGAITMPMFVEVAYGYRNREGYRATVTVRQEYPGDDTEYKATYSYPGRRQPLDCSDWGAPLGPAPVRVPKVVLECFEHLLGRVIAGQDLDEPDASGVFYR